MASCSFRVPPILMPIVLAHLGKNVHHKIRFCIEMSGGEFHVFSTTKSGGPNYLKFGEMHLIETWCLNQGTGFFRPNFTIIPYG